MPDEQKELKFPLDFNECPLCGSIRKVAETILNQEKEAKRIGANARAAIHVAKSMIADPRMIGLKAPVIISFLDICADCGAVYCVHAELGTATTTTLPKGPNIRGLGSQHQGFSPS